MLHIIQAHAGEPEPGAAEGLHRPDQTYQGGVAGRQGHGSGQSSSLIT